MCPSGASRLPGHSAAEHAWGHFPLTPKGLAALPQAELETTKMRSWSEAESRDAAAAEALSMMRMRLTVSETKVCSGGVADTVRAAHVACRPVCSQLRGQK